MKETWVKPWEREYSLHRMSQVMEGLFSEYAKKTTGFQAWRQVALRMPNGNDASFFDSRDWAKFHSYVQKIFLNQKNFKAFLRAYEANKKAFVEISRATGKDASKTAGGKELSSLFSRFSEAHLRYMLIGQYTAFYLVELCDKLTAELVHNSEDLKIALTPEKTSQIRKERQSMLRIALEKNLPKRNKMLERHTRRFQWIPCINVLNPPPWDRKFFAKQLELLIRSRTAAEELANMKGGIRKGRAAFQKLRRRYSKGDKELLDRAHLLAFVKDDRDDARRLAYFFARPLYTAIAKALNLSHTELFLLTTKEITDALKTAVRPSKKELKVRQRGYALIVRKNGIEVKTGRAYRDLLVKLVGAEIMTSRIQGIPASAGVVRGTVKISPNIYSLGKIKRGDILVTVATHPDYLPAMRLAKAIVTDEGGMTSHAAIVSRELGIPCIVGTKIATQILKDGDLVEVDANTGIVKKLH